MAMPLMDQNDLFGEIDALLFAEDDDAEMVNDIVFEEDDDEMKDADGAEDDVLLPCEEQERELLQAEVAMLNAQLAFLQLRSRASAERETPEVLTAKMLAESNNQQLEEAKKLQHELQNLVREQDLAYQAMNSLVACCAPSLLHYRRTLLTPLHSFMSLPSSPMERRAALMSVRDERINSALRFVMSLEMPYSSGNDTSEPFSMTDSFERFGKVYKVESGQIRRDHLTVDDIMVGIYNDSYAGNDTITGPVKTRKLLDAVQYAFINLHTLARVGVPKRDKKDRGFVVEEGDHAFFLKKIGEVGVMLCDSIDEDAAHPHLRSHRVRKEVLAAIILLPQTNQDGRQGVLIKQFSFAKYDLGLLEPTPVLLQALTASASQWSQALRAFIANLPSKHQPPRKWMGSR